jgi:hypothetical protein
VRLGGYSRRLCIVWGAPLFALVTAVPAQAWYARTHQLIVRLAIAGLPPSALKTIFERKTDQLQEFAIEPDSVLRPMYGDTEGRRHYINLEYFGADPFAQLDPDYAAMRRKVGERTLERSGTLPWAIEAEAAATAAAWRSSDCAGLLRHAGYLAHYVGDASQPLHTTKDYDGSSPDDRGMHARLESSADHRVREIATLDGDRVHTQDLTAIWPSITAEMKQAHALIPAIMGNDRAVRNGANEGGAAYTNALMDRELPLIAGQVSDAANVLGSIWLFEWRQAGSSAACLSDGAALR